MGLTDTSDLLRDGMMRTLATWKNKFSGEQDVLYWVLRLKLVETGLDYETTTAQVLKTVPEAIGEEVGRRFEKGIRYWGDIRYSALHPVTQVWGTIVNTLRVVSQSSRVTEGQRTTFDYDASSVLGFFRAARARMEIADALYHAFRAMPAPECQALAALLNVHVDAALDVSTMCRLVRLLDHEGRMNQEEREALETLTKTALVNATFRGLRGNA